jgi:hypothetical protein
MEYNLMFWIISTMISIGIIGKVIIILKLSFSYSTGVESIIRISAFSAGCFIYLIARSFGVSITDVMISALITGSLFKYSMLGFIIPAILGYLLSEYIIYTVKRNEDVALRVLILLCTISIFQYGDLFISALRATKSIPELMPEKLLVSNVMFTIAIIIDVIFKYKPQKKTYNAA